MTTRILSGDCRDILPTLPPQSVHCVSTSPPYFGLRSYLPDGHTDKHSEIGGESSLDEYITALVDVFREVRRVLRDDGTVWLNLGDSYAGSWGNYGGQNRGNGKQRTITTGSKAPQKAYDGLADWRPATSQPQDGLKPKDLMMVPARVALALQADGWYLRSDIIWAKKNCMPESVTDRPTSAHEHIFLLTKNPRYYFDMEAVREDATPGSIERSKYLFGGAKNGHLKATDVPTAVVGEREITGRNIRNVWRLATQPLPMAHFATFPPALVEPCIKAGTSEKGCCAACGAPYIRQKLYNNEDGNVHLPYMSAVVTEGSLRKRQSEEGWSAAHLPGMRCDTATSAMDEEPRARTGAVEEIPGTAFRGNSRAEAQVSADGARTRIDAGPLAGIYPDGAWASGEAGISSAVEQDGEGENQCSDSLQPQASTDDECAWDIHGRGLDSDIGAAEPSLSVLPSAIHHRTSSDNGSCDSDLEGRAPQSREHRGSLPPVQFSEARQDTDVAPTWIPSCTCNAAVVPCTVLDPFGGAGTVGLVADRLGRNSILIELSESYALMSKQRIEGDAPMFTHVSVD